MQQISDYLTLIKFRVNSLVLFTTAIGMILAAGDLGISLAALPWLTVLGFVACGVFGAAAFNMAFEGDVDGLMSRTCRRPVPAGRIAPSHAYIFSAILCVIGVAGLLLTIGALAACLLAIAILIYTAVYTAWLKRTTPQNIVIGGGAGALAPLIGYSAITDELSLTPIALGVAIFLWTPPHFWTLALYHEDEYARAKIPMMNNIIGPLKTARQIFFYTLLTALAIIYAGISAGLTWVVLLQLGFFSALWLGLCLRTWWALHKNKAFEGTAKKGFRMSIFFLFITCSLIIFGHA
ncbi:MAG: heme o synthase [Pseudomonadota bacterium]